MFNLEDQKYIKLLDLNAQIYTESNFNCKHIHLDSKSDEKVFMVAFRTCLLYTSPSPRDGLLSRMPSSA